MERHNKPPANKEAEDDAAFSRGGFARRDATEKGPPK